MKVQVKGLRINYTVCGSGNPVVILHGWGKDSSYMKNVASVFEQTHHTVYTIDLPGFGLSERPDKPWDIYDYEDCITKFVQYFNIENVTLVGHSFGGAIALCMTYSKLISVKALYLIDSSGIKEKTTAKVYAKILCFKLAKCIFKFMPLCHKKKEKLLRKVIRHVASNDYQNVTGVMRDTLVRVVNTDITYALSKINVPTTLIWGENDEKTSLENAQYMNGCIKNSKLKIIKNSGHEPFIDSPEEFYDVMSNEIRRIKMAI